MEDRKIFRIIVALIALVGATFMGGDQITTNYLIGCGAIIFATFILYMFGFEEEEKNGTI